MKRLLTRFWKKNCLLVEADLWDYADERLTEDKLERVEGHLAVCESCRIQAEGFAHAQGALLEASRDVLPAPRSGWRELERRLDLEAVPVSFPVEESRLRSRSARFLSGLAPASSVATLLLVGVLLYRTYAAAPFLPAEEGERISARRPSVSGFSLHPEASAPDPISEVTFKSLLDTNTADLQPVGYKPLLEREVKPQTTARMRRPLSSFPRAELVKPSKAVGLPKETRSPLRKTSRSEEFSFHSQKPAVGEHVTERPGSERQTYVSSSLVPVSNDDVY